MIKYIKMFLIMFYNLQILNTYVTIPIHEKIIGTCTYNDKTCENKVLIPYFHDLKIGP